MIVFYGIVEDVPNDYGYINVESDYSLEDLLTVSDILLDTDRSWWMVPGTLENCI